MGFSLRDLPPDVRKSLGLTAPKRKKASTPRPEPVPVTEFREWTFVVPNYLPPSINKLLNNHWRQRYRMKCACAGLFAHYGREVPKAVSKRTVLFTLVRAGRDMEQDDDNAAKKVGLDALVSCGLLVDDRPKWCECLKPVQIKAQGDTGRQTIVTLREVPE